MFAIYVEKKCFTGKNLVLKHSKKVKIIKTNCFLLSTLFALQTSKKHEWFKPDLMSDDSCSKHVC